MRKTAASLKTLWNEPSVLIAIILISVLLILFVLFPLFQVFRNCFIVREAGESRITFRYFVELLSKPYNRRPIYNSVVLGFCVAVFGTFVGFVFAYAITRTDIPFKRFFQSAAILPIISPPFVIALSAILLFGRNGLITRKIFLDALGVDLYSAGFDIYGVFVLLL